MAGVRSEKEASGYSQDLDMFRRVHHDRACSSRAHVSFNLNRVGVTFRCHSNVTERCQRLKQPATEPTSCTENKRVDVG